MRELRHRMERELGKETPGRLHVKFGRGGLVDVEFITQALVMLHGARHPAIRRANTIHAIAAIRRAGLLSDDDADTLAGHYRFLRRVSGALRLFGARPSDTLEPAGPIPGRIAKSLDYPRAWSSSRTTAAARPGSARSTTGSSPRAEAPGPEPSRRPAP
jgi:glutamate-ammonia-ligase adenylyltransferase